MKIGNRIFSCMLLIIAGMAGGSILIMNWRILALGIIAVLCLTLGINFWRATFADLEIKNPGQSIWKTKLHPAILIPVITLSFGAAIAGWLLGMID